MSDSEEEEQKNDSSILSNFVNVISGAKQSATTEFDRFCENIGWRPKRRPILVRNKFDMARVQAGQSIHGRILPDTYRHSIGKDVEIQTDVIPEQEEFEGQKRRQSVGSINSDRSNEVYRPAKMIKNMHMASSSSPRRNDIALSQLVREGIFQQPDNSSTGSGTENSLLPNLHSDNNNSYSNKEPQSKFTTGSKSVKRLTSELEKIFSAQQIPSFKKTKIEHKEMGQSLPQSFEPIIKVDRRSSFGNESMAHIFENDMTLEEQRNTAVPEAPPLSSSIQNTPKDENTSERLKLEEERMQLLEKKLGDIHCQMNNFVSRDPNYNPPTTVSQSTSPIKHSVPLNSTPIRSNATSKPESPIRSIAALKLSPIRSTFSSDTTSNRYISPKSINYNTSSPARDLPKHIGKPASPIPKPNEKHISTMRVLIRQIPEFQLRKTDKIIGPDGEERPNPIWHEIYGRRAF